MTPNRHARRSDVRQAHPRSIAELVIAYCVTMGLSLVLIGGITVASLTL